MRKSEIRELIEQGAILNGPLRPSSSADRARIAAMLRARRAARTA
jgi:hypothetical protein